ncbi:MAG: glycosyltransferase family 2 protein [Geminicoccaceae bacterium]
MGASADRCDRPKVSVITVVLNGGEALLRTIQSVLAQTYQPIEYIVIDGGSTDGSVDLIKRHHNSIAFWISEPDRGISDAFNKGIAAATGDYVGLLNADDWLSPDQIETAVAALETGKARQAGEASFAFGNLMYYASDGTPLHLIQGDPSYADKIESRMPALNHPTMLVRRSLFETLGGFDQRYRVAMDYDWVLRAHLAGHRGVHAPGVLGHMTLAGTSDRRFVEGLSEVRRIAISHGQPRLRAWPLFGFRVLKGVMQRRLQRHAPASIYRRLRRWINRDYRSLASAAERDS